MLTVQSSHKRTFSIHSRHPHIMISSYHTLAKDATAAAESLGVMMQKERQMFSGCGYLDHSSSSSEASSVKKSERMEVVDWCYSVVDIFQYDRETVSIAMQMVDRFLSKPNRTTHIILHDRMQFQLLAVSALYIAIKINGKDVLDSGLLSELVGGLYTVNEIESMELSILDGLSWRICAPTSLQIAYHVLSLFLPYLQLEEPKVIFVLDAVRFQIEMSVRDHYLATQLPSTVAMAAIANAFDQVDHHKYQAIIHAILLSINKDMGFVEHLFATKHILQRMVNGSDSFHEITCGPEMPEDIETSPCSKNQKSLSSVHLKML